QQQGPLFRRRPRERQRFGRDGARHARSIARLRRIAGRSVAALSLRTIDPLFASVADPARDPRLGDRLDDARLRRPRARGAARELSGMETRAQLEPASLVRSFLAHPPRGFSPCRIGLIGSPTAALPGFVTDFDVTTTLDAPVKRAFERLPIRVRGMLQLRT